MPSKSRNRIGGLVLAIAGSTVLAGWAADAAAQLLAQAFNRVGTFSGGTR